MTQGSLKKPSAEPSSQLPGHLPQSTVSEITAWLVGQPLDAVERELIRHTLDACDGDRALTASVLGISLPALRKKMTAYKVRGKPLPVPVDHANENRDTAPKPPAAAAEPEIAAEPAIAAPEPELSFEPSPVQWTAPEELAAAILSNAAASANSEVAAAPVLWAAPEELAAALLSDATAASAESYSVADSAPVEPAPQVKRLVPAAIVMPAPPKPTQRRMPSARLIGAVGLAAGLLALIGFGMTGSNEPAKDLVMRQHPPIEMSVKEKPLPFEQRIQVPAWVAGPPLAPAARTVASFDPTLDTRMELAPPPSAAIAAALKIAQGALASASIDLDTRMDGPPQSAALRAALKTAQGALASASIELDTRMDGPPQSAAMRAALKTAQGALASASIDLDTRMEVPAPEIAATATEAAPGEPQTTGSIPEPTFFKAPKTAPMPEVRRGPVEHPRTAPPPVQRRAAPPRAPQAQAQPSDLPRQILFPFANIFNPKAQQGER